MKALQTASAVIEVGAGAALLCAPSGAAMLLLGAPLHEPVAIVLARLGGAGLLSLGVACWLARDDAHSPAARAVVTAMLLYDIAAAGILAFAGIALQLSGLALWPAVVLHTAMAAWCVFCLKSQKHDRRTGPV